MNNTGNQEINPITRLDYPDPDVIRVDNTYYMVSTTMHFMPGCEILRSYDLVNWEHASYVYDVLDSTPGQKIEGEENIYGQGMWAASLRYHKGIFYVCFVANDTGKTYIYSAPSIEGPWKKSYIKGFYHDCSILFDDDDRVYIASGNKYIRLQELDADLSGPKEGGIDRIVVKDEGHPGLGYEGTHFYKINGKYYLFFIHSLRKEWKRVEACFVSDSLEGEFTGGDVLNDDMGYCNQGVAQGGIVDTPDGKWYAVDATKKYYKNKDTSSAYYYKDIPEGDKSIEEKVQKRENKESKRIEEIKTSNEKNMERAKKNFESGAVFQADDEKLIPSLLQYINEQVNTNVKSSQPITAVIYTGGRNFQEFNKQRFSYNGFTGKLDEVIEHEIIGKTINGYYIGNYSNCVIDYQKNKGTDGTSIFVTTWKDKDGKDYIIFRVALNPRDRVTASKGE